LSESFNIARFNLNTDLSRFDFNQSLASNIPGLSDFHYTCSSATEVSWLR